MGEQFIINGDGSITRYNRKTLNNIKWIDYKQYKGKWSAWQVIFCILCFAPVYGQILGILVFVCIRIFKGYWPIFGIRAIEDTNNQIKIYCNKNGMLGLYTNKHRITPAKYISIQQLPTNGYPTFICENDGRFCLYNFIQNKILFNDSERITYLGDNAVLIENENKKEKYSVIGIRLD